jgi:hypothetical protein
VGLLDFGFARHRLRAGGFVGEGSHGTLSGGGRGAYFVFRQWNKLYRILQKQ